MQPSASLSHCSPPPPPPPPPPPLPPPWHDPPPSSLPTLRPTIFQHLAILCFGPATSGNNAGDGLKTNNKKSSKASKSPSKNKKARKKTQSSTLPLEVPGDAMKYTISKLLDVRGTGKDQEFYMEYVGYENEPSWEPGTIIRQDAPSLVASFLRRKRQQQLQQQEASAPPLQEEVPNPRVEWQSSTYPEAPLTLISDFEQTLKYPCWNEVKNLNEKSTDQQLSSALLETMITLHVMSRPLAKLPIIYKVHTATTTVWRQQCENFAPILHGAIDRFEQNPHDIEAQLTLTRAAIDLMAIPSQLFIPTSNLKPVNGSIQVNIDNKSYELNLETPNAPGFSYKTPELGTVTSLDERIRKAIKQVKAGNNKKATQTLYSNGIAQPSRQISQRLQSLHPRSATGIRPDISVDPQNPPPQVPLKNFTDELKRKAGFKGESIDVYGWRPDFLKYMRSPKGNHDSFINGFGRLMQILTTDKAPMSLLYFLSPTSSVALNKVTPEENKEKVTQGLPQEIRPLSLGAFASKVATGVTLRSIPRGPLIHSLQKAGQQGLGVSDGPVEAAIVLQTAYKQEYVINAKDAANAFPSLNRQALATAIKEHLPQALQTCKNIYSFPSPTFFQYTEDGTCHIDVSFMDDGIKIGCTSASLFFNVSVHDAVYSQLPTNDKYVEKNVALTDDHFEVMKPPPRGSPLEAFEEFYDAVAARISLFAQLASKIGIMLTKEVLFLLMQLEHMRQVARVRMVQGFRHIIV